MQKILLKRAFRNLKTDFPKYLALLVMIAISIYIVVSFIGSAETVIVGGVNTREQYKCEDGQFTTFIPLSEKEEKSITDEGVTLERMFYSDYLLEDGDILRLFKNREKIDLNIISDGKLSSARNEIVIDRRYCEDNDVSVGDKISIGNTELTVSGIGVTTDYESNLKNISDAAVSSNKFGVAWVTDETYEDILRNEKSMKAEEYLYAYHLNGKITNDELKDKIKDFEFDASKVDDEYFQEFWDSTMGQKKDIEDGIDELVDGVEEFTDGLKELADASPDLIDGADNVFDAYLSEASKVLSSMGINKKLTSENFETELNEIADSMPVPAMKSGIEDLKKQLMSLKEFSDGINEYTDGVADAEEGAVELKDGVNELDEGIQEMIDEVFADSGVHNLESFIVSGDNPRIASATADCEINVSSSYFAGVIIMILFAYIISVFVSHEIERDTSIIGALYAMGVTKRDLLLHYLLIPSVVTAIAGIIGMVLGFSDLGMGPQMAITTSYFSLPDLEYQYPTGAIIYSVVMPPVMVILVNLLVLSKKLNRPVLSLIKNEVKHRKVADFKIGKMGFVGKFQIRQMIRERRSVLTILFGIFLSVLLLMMGLNCYEVCTNSAERAEEDIKYSYMYVYKYPTEEVPDGAEEAYGEVLQTESFGYKFDITLLGINEDNPYFEVETYKNQKDVAITSAMATKFGIKEGEAITLTSPETDRMYAFRVGKIVPYAASFFVFMDIDEMRDMMGVDDTFFNMAFSAEDLHIPSGQLYSTTSREDIYKGFEIFIEMMGSLVQTMTIMPSLVFVFVLFILMKIMIDRSTQNISMFRVFGFTDKEIKKLYLNGNFYVVAIGMLIIIPLAKKIMDAMYPYLCSNAAVGLFLDFPWYTYVGIYVAALVLYFIINTLLLFRIKKITPAEALKNRE